MAEEVAGRINCCCRHCCCEVLVINIWGAHQNPWQLPKWVCDWSIHFVLTHGGSSAMEPGQDAWCQPSNNSAWWIIPEHLRQQGAYYEAYAMEQIHALSEEKILEWWSTLWWSSNFWVTIDLGILVCPGGKFNFRYSTYDTENSSGLVRQEPGKASSLPKVCGCYSVCFSYSPTSTD